MKNILRKMLKRSSQDKEAEVWLHKDDYFLLSYPKSGITWVRFLVGNLLVSDEITFQNIDKIIPVVGQRELIDAVPPPRIVKSHELNNPHIKKGVYIVRDGRDVYTSYYHYRKNKLPEGATFSYYLREYSHWPSTWSDHIFSWLPDGKVPQNLLVIRYEDLIEKAPKELERIARFFEINVSREDILRSVDSSSFSAMKNLEAVKGRSDEKSKGITLIRQGIVGDWRNYFSPDDIKFFKEREGKALIALGYEDNNDW